MAEVEAKAMAPRLEGSRAKAKAKAKGPTWAEYQAMQKRLQSLDDKANDLSWRLIREKFRSCFGDKALEAMFAPLSNGFSQQSHYSTLMPLGMGFTSEVELRRRHNSALMALCVDLTCLFEERRRHSCTSGGLVSKRLRKEEEEEEDTDEEDEESLMQPPHIKLMEEEWRRLTREYLQLRSLDRGPDFSGMTEADRAAEAERLREEAFQEATRLLMEEGDMVGALEYQARACVLDLDPKQGGIYWNSFNFPDDPATFDHSEESPIGPMRFTNKVFQEREIDLAEAVNILSVKVARSDVGFPIHVYGTVIARDCTDYKRVYLFHRDRQHCQLINSKDEPLILTGPKRGLLLLDENFVETDLMIKDDQGQDRELSKGILSIRGIAGWSLDKCEVDRLSLATRLSTVQVAYALVISAVEATISIDVEEGEFCGRVTAHTTSIKNRLVLYDSQLADHMPGNGHGAIKMMRPVISVCAEDKLIIIARVHGGKAVGFEITPRISNGDEVEFTLGTAKMRLRVVWSILDRVAAEY